MKFKIDHDLHIHSQLSSCSSDPGQTPNAILDYAERNGLHTVCLTDHYWDSAVPGVSNWYRPQNFDHLAEALPLPQGEETSFLFGCETDFDKKFTLGIPSSRFDDFDFVIIPTTHLHMTGFTIAEEDKNSDERRAALWVERLDRVLDMDLPFRKIGIAHLACPLINKHGYLPVLDLIPTEEMERVFAKAAARGCGIELNAGDFRFSDADADRVLRIFRVAKGCGCKFYLGSDAHHPSQLDAAIAHFDRAVTLLGLTENDKFSIPSRKNR
ncbi:MAG: hypothetical protein II955_03605 [Clostridia bacterium]|nr:hypothetical protein [Clostridia bacterium]